MARYRNSKKQKKFGKRGLILCEGESEENYFKGLITQDKYKRKFQAIDVNIFKPKDHSPVGLVNEAKRLIKKARRENNPYAFIWVVFDKDGHARIPDAFEIARNSRPKINIAFTAPCFEFYILLHFGKTT
ncbi:RloB family protein, partial [Longispora fulva]|uniref:RloB family protein n=1 Tax=Longispora fulva TaxID=619741 RepID=UPI003645780A